MEKINDNYVAGLPSRQNVVDIFKGQWLSAFPAKEELVSGGAMGLYEDGRIRWLIDRLGSAIVDLRCIELGPFEAGHTYMLHKAGARDIVGIEANSISFMKSLIAKTVFNMNRLSLLRGEIEEFLNSGAPKADLMVASGVLYHFEDPLLALLNMTKAAPRIFLWTHYMDEQHMPSGDARRGAFSGEKRTRLIGGFSCTYHVRSYQGGENAAAFCGGVHSGSVWMEHGAIVNAMKHWGYRVEEIMPHPAHPVGPASCFYAWRE